tara:strand:- start:480 stop:1607 length:1128 start_codon:yes stop_codon:yes gene_type:complete
MSSINLAQLLPALETGGVETGVVDLSNYLSSQKIQNIIISNGGKMVERLNDNHSKHYKLNVNTKNFILYPSLANKINNLLIQNNINILHVRSRGPAWMVNLIKNKNYNTVATFHNVYNGKNFLKKYYNKGLAKMDYIIANSNYVKEQIIKKYNLKKNVTVISRGIDTDFFDIKKINLKEIESIKEKINYNTSRKIILFPGRLTSWKGQNEFLKKLERFKDDKYIFYFVGGVTSKSYLKEINNQINKLKLNNICKVLGKLNNHELRALISLSYIILSLPKIPEGFGRIISEALSMNKIVLGFDYGGVRDQLNKLDNFFKIEPQNYNEVFFKISEIEKFTSVEIENLNKFSRDHIVNNFSLKNMVKSYEEFYQSILV